MVRILITRRGVPGMKLDGINDFISKISDYFLSNGFEVTIAGIGDFDLDAYRRLFGMSNYPSFTKISEIRNLRFLSDIEYQLKLLLHIRRNDYDLVVQNGIAYLPSSRKVLLICHDLEKTSWFTILQKLSQRYIYGRKKFHVAATSSEIQSELSKFLKRQVDLVPTCVSIADFAEPTVSRFRLTHIGTDPWKNPKASLKLFEELNIENSILTFIGGKTDELDALIDTQYNLLKHRIVFVSGLNRRDYLRVLQESWYCLVPSVYHVGVLSPTILDSYSQGTPVIASTKSISSDLFKCNDTGFCLNSCCLKLASKRFNWIIHSERTQIVAKAFTPENVVKKILDITKIKI